MNLDALREQLVRHEGERLKPYRCTAGKLTIGVGRNLDDKGITREESRLLLEHDIASVIADLRAHLPWFDRLDDVRQRVLVNMGFNLGVPGLLAFTNTLRAVEAGRWGEAAHGMLNSKWAGQVGRRAIELAEMMRDGKDR